MEIKLSKPNAFIDVAIDKAASDSGCVAKLKWWRPDNARFILVDRIMSDRPATFEQHDSVIRLLLEQNPQATVRTARATFEGLLDWQAQMKARVPA